MRSFDVDITHSLIARCVLLVVLCWHGLVAAEPVSLAESHHNQLLGRHVTYLLEQDAPLTVAQAQAAQASGLFTASKTAILNFGMSPRAAWLMLPINNPFDEHIARRLLIEISWLDKLDIYFVHNNNVVDRYELGDSRLFNDRAIRSRFFAVDHEFESGATAIYMRVATADPMVLPISLLTADDANERESNQSYSYGFMYGYLLALLAYNIVLFFTLRDKRHGYYSNFLAAFVLLNIAYTGHGYLWFWSNDPFVQRWIIPILIGAYGVSGLAFAKRFLNTAVSLPRSHRFIAWVVNGFVLALTVAVLFGHTQRYALLIAFAFVILFSAAMLWLGALSWYAGHRYARYFLFASIASMIGTALTTLSVWNFVPYSDWTFHAAEIGTLIDATLLALALGKQFRTIQRESVVAERRASRDPLTDLYNRRSFMETAESIWSAALRDERDLALIMIDLDHFKTINDVHGHGVGDAALVATANVLMAAVRGGDVIARWGGEEFLLLLPATKLDAAFALAERLRHHIAAIRLPAGKSTIRLTASMGVACRGTHRNIDSLITEVDYFLYQSKNNGRNRVSAVSNSEPFLKAPA